MPKSVAFFLALARFLIRPQAADPVYYGGYGGVVVVVWWWLGGGTFESLVLFFCTFDPASLTYFQ